MLANYVEESAASHISRLTEGLRSSFSLNVDPPCVPDGAVISAFFHRMDNAWFFCWDQCCCWKVTEGSSEASSTTGGVWKWSVLPSPWSHWWYRRHPAPAVAAGWDSASFRVWARNQNWQYTRLQNKESSQMVVTSCAVCRNCFWNRNMWREYTLFTRQWALWTGPGLANFAPRSRVPQMKMSTNSRKVCMVIAVLFCLKGSSAMNVFILSTVSVFSSAFRTSGSFCPSS